MPNAFTNGASASPVETSHLARFAEAHLGKLLTFHVIRLAHIDSVTTFLHAKTLLPHLCLNMQVSCGATFVPFATKVSLCVTSSSSRHPPPCATRSARFPPWRPQSTVINFSLFRINAQSPSLSSILIRFTAFQRSSISQWMIKRLQEEASTGVRPITLGTSPALSEASNTLFMVPMALWKSELCGTRKTESGPLLDLAASMFASRASSARHAKRPALHVLGMLTTMTSSMPLFLTPNTLWRTQSPSWTLAVRASLHGVVTHA
mmetsp:Transcript_11910/g.23368  ORF Transcript_11910/g.23368 Transcript_11910/m.23368 type:complete len:263 (+) Transcript_11910:1840-2628(+)